MWIWDFCILLKFHGLSHFPPCYFPLPFRSISQPLLCLWLGPECSSAAVQGYIALRLCSATTTATPHSFPAELRYQKRNTRFWQNLRWCKLAMTHRFHGATLIWTSAEVEPYTFKKMCLENNTFRSWSQQENHYAIAV